MEKNSKYEINSWVEKDITQDVLTGKLPRAFCVENHINGIKNILDSGKFPILIGDSGVGKTAVIYQYISENIETLSNKRILQISIKQMASTLKDPYQQIGFEMKKLVDYLIKHKENVLPVFRDIHLAYQFNLDSQLLFLGLQFDSVLFAEGIQSVIKSMFEDTGELEQYFITVKIEEPGIDATLNILSKWALERKKSDGLRFDTEVLEEAVYLSHRFLTRDRLPRKAIFLLDQISSFKTDKKIINTRDVIERFCSSHQIPRFLIDPSIKLDLAETERFFQSQVLGQEEAVEAIIKMISLLKAGLSDIRRPFGVFLFVGPTGVGKTYIAQSLAQFFFNNHEKVIRINMADYPRDFHAFTLFGNPNEYSLMLKRGLLTRKIMGQPFSILLLDEFEKSHRVIHDRFLQLVDEGCFINGAGETVSCRSMIIIATSNAGADIYRKNVLGFTKGMNFSQIDKEIDQELLNLFRFEFLNRFDQIVHFHPLKREHIRTIALRELESIKNRIGIKQRGYIIDFDEGVIDWLVVNGFDEDYGARFLRRIMEKNVSTALADYIVRFSPAKKSHILLTVRKNKIIAKNAVSSQKAEFSISRQYKKATVKINEGNVSKVVKSILDRAEDKLTLLKKHKKEAEKLLSVMNEDDFWEKKMKKREVIEKYKMLEVTVSIEERLASPIIKLKEACDSESDLGLSSYNSIIEKAADSLYSWEERLAESMGSTVWMIISGFDNPAEDNSWIVQLMNFEKRWCRRLNLYSTVAAFSTKDEQLIKIILEVNGPGAYTYLSMEQGLHRRLNQNRKNERAQIEIMKRTILPDIENIKVKQVKKKNSLLKMDVSYSYKMENRKLGIQFDLLSSNPDVLKNIVYDLKKKDKQGPEAEVARVYGENGLVKDPRTGISMQDNKQLWKGNLDDFLDAWMATINVKE